MSGDSFNAGTLSTIENCIDKVSSNINRGTLGSTSKPTYTEVQNWLVEAKERIQEVHNFSWGSVFVYMDTTLNEYRYALPPDFSGGGYVLRDITNDARLTPLDSVAFDSIFYDVAGDSSDTPEYYTIRDREIWLSQPASGTYRLELWYTRTGEDSNPTDISYLPEIMRFKMCDYATYRAFLVLHMWEGASAYKSEWEQGMGVSKKKEGKQRWAAIGYKVRGFVV